MPKLSFWAMHPQQELSKTLRAGLIYLMRIATEEDWFAFLRYYVRDMAFTVELLVQGLYLSGRAHGGHSSTYGDALYGSVRSGIGREGFKPLSLFLKLVSLFFETILPYFCEKIEARLNEIDYPRLKKLFTYLCRIGSVLEFVWQFKYLINDEHKFYRPYL